MCEYCDKRIRNKKIKDVDNDKLDWLEVIEQKKTFGHMLYVELDAVDSDGYKACDFFQIDYCPMCRKEVNIVDIEEAKETYEMLKKYKELVANIDKDFFLNFAETVLNELEKKGKEIEQLEIKIDNLTEEQNEREKYTHKLEQKIQKENEEKDKRINDLEFALLDMVMQFANRVKTKGCSYALDTMGLSALELAFNELRFNEMYSVNKAEEKYKILEKQYYEN